MTLHLQIYRKLNETILMIGYRKFLFLLVIFRPVIWSLIKVFEKEQNLIKPE